MKIKDFKLEVYFNEYEFKAPYLLTQSDCQSMSIKELLDYEENSQEDFLNSYLGYTEVNGNKNLRRIISSFYKNINEDNILVHSGAQEAIFNFMNIFLEKNDHIITQFPIYQSLYEVASSIGCSYSKWNIHQKNNNWEMEIDELESLITKDTKLIVLNSPNNPTGFSPTDSQLLKIIEIAKKYNLYIFCDEVYKDLEIDNIKRSSCASLYEKAISLGVMSKSYGLAGLRIGWVATQDIKIINKMTKMKHYTSICSSAPSEFLATIALKHSKEILDKNLELIKNNLQIADTFFKKYKNLFTYNRPMAGPVGFIKINIDEKINDFCDKLVKEKGVLLLPANIYNFDEQYFRIGFGRKNFKESLMKFEEFLIENKYV